MYAFQQQNARRGARRLLLLLETFRWRNRSDVRQQCEVRMGWRRCFVLRTVAPANTRRVFRWYPVLFGSRNLPAFPCQYTSYR